ncbi:hypothetical protein STEG23_009035 [Scotinomys teguina]
MNNIRLQCEVWTSSNIDVSVIMANALLSYRKLNSDTSNHNLDIIYDANTSSVNMTYNESIVRHRSLLE